jgi:hypothetical protein
MKFIYCATFVACLLFPSFSIDAQGWKPANTPTGINQIRDMIPFGGYLFISLESVVYRSDDHGLSWERVDTPSSYYTCFFVVHNGELFIVSQTYVGRSLNGLDWNFQGVVTPGLNVVNVTSDGSKLWASKL